MSHKLETLTPEDAATLRDLTLRAKPTQPMSMDDVDTLIRLVKQYDGKVISDLIDVHVAERQAMRHPS